MSIPNKIRATGWRQFQPVIKAGKKAMAVYDSQGNLLGTCDPALVAVLAQPDDGGKSAEAARVNAQAAKVTAQHPAPDPTAQDTVVADLTKEAVSILKAVRPRPASELVDVRKAATTLDKQWRGLLEAVGSSRAVQLQSAVATSSIALMTSGRRLEGKQAIGIAKRAVLTAALNRRVI